MLLKKKLFKSALSILLVLLLTISCLPITVSAATLKIVDVEIEPITIAEHTEGSYIFENNIKYYYYEPKYVMEYTVTFSDGTVIEDFSYGFYYNDDWYRFDTYTNQSYNNQWKAGNTYTMEVSISNISVDVPVTITKCPIESIEIEPITILEYTNGYYNEDYNNKTDEWDLEYYCYRPQNEMKYTVTFTDGTVAYGKDTWFEHNGEDYYLYTNTEQSYYNQWTAGNTYYMDVTIYGYDITVPVTITESSVRSIEIEPITIIEYTNGYYNRDYYEDDEGSPLYYFYSIYDQITYTATLKDGTVINNKDDYFEYGDEYYSFDINTNQSYENRWLVGNTYTAEIKMGKFNVEVPVTIIESPIVSLEAKPISIMEGTNGYLQTEYDDMDDPIGEYYHYQPEYLLEYVITFNDGTVIEDYSNWFVYNGEEYELEIYTDQSYNNQWTSDNTYTMSAKVMGYTVDVPITITETPIKSIEIEPISIVEGTNGYFVYTDEDDEFTGKYYKYEPENFLAYTVTLKDDTVIEDYGSWFEYNDNSYYLDTQTDQSYDNQWTAGNTYEMKVTLGKLTVNVPVTITPPPVKSIEVKPVTLIEFTGGYYNNEYNPETDKYDLKYFYYEPEYEIKYTVTLNDGTVLTGSYDYIEIGGEDFWFDISTDQSYENQWTVGNTYTMEVSLMGISTEVDVTIAETPIKDIIVEPITIYKDIDSYVDTAYNPDTDEYDAEYDYYTYDNQIKYTILFKDGTKAEYQNYDDVIYNDSFYYINVYDNQSYDTSWTVGNTYNASLSVLGKTVDIPISIKASPVKSIEFIKAPDKTEYVSGEPLDLKGAVLRINYTDNTYEDIEFKNHTSSFQGYGIPLYIKRFDNEYSLKFTQYYANTNITSLKIKLLGKEAETNISVASKSIDAISLSGKGIDLTMEITYSDNTKQTVKILDFDARSDYGSETEYFRGGFIITDKGIFTGGITRINATGDFYATLILNHNYGSRRITSNTISSTQCNWWDLQENIYSLVPAISRYAESITSYNGKVTAENIDELLSVACSATDLYYDSDSFTSIKGNEYVFYADRVKASFLEIFGFTPDLTLSSNYNAKDNTITVTTGIFGSLSYNHPIQVEQTKDSITVKIECNSSLYGTYPMTITFDNDLNVTAFNYSDTEETIITGDVNNDGIINVIDATEIQKYLAGLVEFDSTEMKVADFNGDSTVSIIDATNIQKKLAGLI